MADQPFWRAKGLNEMSPQEWEALCDGCARCCLLKLEDEESGDVAYTDIACRLLDRGACRCTRYGQRRALVPDCVVLTPEDLPRIARWMPPTCAYRLLWEGKDLYWWHPLVSGDPETVHAAGVSVRGWAVCERDVPEEEEQDHVIPWSRIADPGKPK